VCVGGLLARGGANGGGVLKKKKLR